MIVKINYRWKILIVAYLCMLAYAFVFQSVPPILSLIISTLHLTHTQAGLLMSLFALPGIFVSLPGGMLSDHYGARKVTIISLLFMIVGTTIFMFSTTFFYLSGGRFICGVGALTLGVVTPQLLSQWFLGQELGMAMGIFNTAMPVGTIVCFNLLGRMGKNLGWQSSILVSTLVSIIALITFLFYYQSPPSRKREPIKRAEHPLSLLRTAGLNIWLVGLIWMWFNGAAISFLTFAPDFFVSQGYPLAYAGFLASLLMWGSLFLSPLVGYLIDRLGGKEFLLGMGGIALAIIIFLIPKVSTSPYLTMSFMGIAAASIPAPIFSLPSEILNPESLGLGFGIISTCLNVGVVLGPYLVGLTRDRTGSYEASFLVMSLFALLVTITAITLKIKRKPLKEP